MGAAETEARRLKCRFCSFSVLPFYRDQFGKTKSGFRKLQGHIELRHEAEHEAMMAKIDADCRPISGDAA